MSKYLTVSLLTLAFLLGFLFQAGAFYVVRENSVDPSTAYPRIAPAVPPSAFDGNNNAAVYRDALTDYRDNYITTTSISGFWQ